MTSKCNFDGINGSSFLIKTCKNCKKTSIAFCVGCKFCFDCHDFNQDGSYKCPKC